MLGFCMVDGSLGEGFCLCSSREGKRMVKSTSLLPEAETVEAGLGGFELVRMG
jgi:hypothetical protein